MERSHCSFGVGEGKWYYELQLVKKPQPANPITENWAVGVRESDSLDFYKETDGFEDIGDHVYWADAGDWRIVSNQDRSAGNTTGINNADDGDIINVAWEKTATTLKVWFGLNGTYFNSGNPASGTNPAVDVTSTSRFIIPAAAMYCYVGQNEPVVEFNFGQNPVSLERYLQELNQIVMVRDCLSIYLQVVSYHCVRTTYLLLLFLIPYILKALLYQGNTDQVRPVVGAGFAPDFVWQKDRIAANWHRINDSIRGNYTLYTNATTVEALAESNGHICSLDSDGFTADRIRSSGDATNGSGKYVGCVGKQVSSRSNKH